MKAQLRFLVADDHELIRLAVRAHLNSNFKDAHVEEAQNARQTLELVRQKPWDLLLLDISLPDKSGLDILQDLKLAQPDLPVLVLSGLGEEEFAVPALDAGASGFVSKTGPVQENIIKGDDINLLDFPEPRWHRLDGGRYINTMQGSVTRYPVSGRMNVGIYRGMVGQKDTIPVLLWRPQNWGQDMGKYAGEKREMPVAFIYGWEPCMPFAASSPIPPDVSEYDVMGAIRGAPVKLVDCETVPLQVPASAEIVIEGWISNDPETFEMEGPFGEYTGYFGGDQAKKHKVRVTCIIHRNNPIMRGTLEGAMLKMLSENSVMSSVQRAALAWNILERAGVPGVTDVHCPVANNGTTLMIQLRQIYRGQAKQAAAVWGPEPGAQEHAIPHAAIISVERHEPGADLAVVAPKLRAAPGAGSPGTHSIPPRNSVTASISRISCPL